MTQPITPADFKTAADLILALDMMTAWIYTNSIGSQVKWQCLSKIEELKTYLKSGL